MVLNRHEVRFVVIGGMAAMVRDLPVPATVDIDITPSRDRDNLERLAAALSRSVVRFSLGLHRPGSLTGAGFRPLGLLGSGLGWGGDAQRSLRGSRAGWRRSLWRKRPWSGAGTHRPVYVLVLLIAILADENVLQCPLCRKRVKAGAATCHHCGQGVRIDHAG